MNPSVQEYFDNSTGTKSAVQEAGEGKTLGLHTYYYDTVASQAKLAKNDATIVKSAYTFFTLDTSEVASASYDGVYLIKVETSASSHIRINSSDVWTSPVALNTAVELGYLIISGGAVSYNTEANGTGTAIQPANEDGKRGLKVYYAVEPLQANNTEDGTGDYGSLKVVLVKQEA